MTRCASPESSSSSAQRARNAGAAREHLGDERRLRLPAPPRGSDRRSARRFRRAGRRAWRSARRCRATGHGAPSRRAAAADSSASAAAAPRVARARAEAPRRSRGPAPRRSRSARSSKSTRHWPKRSRRRPRARISAIAAAETAPFSWLTSPWSTRASRRPLRALAAVADPLLVGAAQKQAPSARLVEQARGASAPRRAMHCLRRWPRPSPPASAARSSSAISPTRQCSIAVISARSCSVRRSAGSRKKSARTVASRSRPAARAGAFRSRCRSSDRPFFRHHCSRRLSDFR